jgi:rod shape determining protein RodA
MQPLALSDRLRALPWSVILAIVAIGAFGNLILFSAAGGSMEPWALKQTARFVILLGLMLAIAQIRIEIWIRYAYPIYGAVLLLLMIVEAFVGMGAQRWLDLGVIRLQPSEFMKIAIILALARFYHFLPRSFTERPQAVWPPLALIGVPFILVAIQPDLGTGLMIAFGGIAMLFLAGVRMRWFIGGAALVAAIIPLAYEFLLHDYQRKRILTFLDPSTDPLGAGYHITQSKIAIGSGGLFGKGFLHGTQGALEYLPERQTDFIFAAMAEEWGLVGGIFLFLAYGYVIAWGIGVALSAKSHFARLAAMGLTCTLFFYLAINTAMVMGLAPVVGIPLPLVSYGGSAMLTVLTTMGILISISRHRDRAMLGDHPSAL